MTAPPGSPSPPILWPVVSVSLERDDDVVAVRQRARRLAELFGFDAQDQTRIATAVSEIARNAFGYAGGGRVDFALDNSAFPQRCRIRVTDHGPGIAALDAVLDGRYRSPTGMGLGVTGARRLMEGFTIDTAPGQGTAVTMDKPLPRHALPVTRVRLVEIAGLLAGEARFDGLTAMREQNRELLDTLEVLRTRQDELSQLNAELEDTNRGVVALYGELEDKAEQLRQASELKSRFLSNMSHEFRTPLNSVMALARLLLDRTDGDLTAEQEKQIQLIHKSATQLVDMVNDLLDLAKVEAGKVDILPAPFTADGLLGGLRGVLRPLVAAGPVELVFEDAHHLPPLRTDEGKVAQILRNFISNALKFTERGEVRVSARVAGPDGRIAFHVRDTGIGIAPADIPRVFEEFSQIHGPLQRRAKGTGLGLPLSRKLAELLGGEITVESAPGAGSTFILTIPAVWPADGAGTGAPSGAGDGSRPCLLVIDDEDTFRYVFRRLVSGYALDVAEACDGEEGVRRAAELRPGLILLDLQMPRMNGFAALERLAALPETRGIPVVIVSSSLLTDDDRMRLTHARAILSKGALSRDAVGDVLNAHLPGLRTAAAESH